MPATSLTVTKAVMSVFEEKFTAELRYQTAISIARTLREKGLLTEDEYTVIDTILQKEISPLLGTLLSQNDLI